MRDGWVKLLAGAGAAAACLLSLPALAAPAGKPVPTETIIVPPAGDDAATVAEHAMPSIPSAGRRRRIAGEPRRGGAGSASCRLSAAGQRRQPAEGSADGRV